MKRAHYILGAVWGLSMQCPFPAVISKNMLFYILGHTYKLPEDLP